MADITEASLLTDIRYLLNEPTAIVFTDAEIYLWIDEAAQELSKITFGREQTSTFQLVTATGSYTYATAGCTNAEVIESVLYMGTYAAGTWDTSGEEKTKTLVKIHPRHRATIESGTMANATPQYWYEMDRTIYLYPAPASGQNGDYMRVFYYDYAPEYYSSPTYYLQDHLQEFVIFYTLAKAYQKDQKPAMAQMYYSMFQNYCMFLRQDRIQKLGDTKDMLRLPDYTQVAG